MNHSEFKNLVNAMMDSRHDLSALVRLGEKYTGEPEKQQTLLEAALDGGCTAAIRPLVSLYMSGRLELSKEECSRRAETLLLRLLDKQKTAEDCYRIAVLYAERMNRPAAALGYYMMAKRLGYSVEASTIEALEQRLESWSEEQFRAHSADCRIPGLEYSRDPRTIKTAMLLLGYAARADETGIVALQLGDLANHYGYSKVAARAYAAARTKGCPDLISGPECCPRYGARAGT